MGALTKLSTVRGMLVNMGPRYLLYRLRHAFEIKVGVLQRRIPSDPPEVVGTSLARFRQNPPAFFFSDRETVRVPRAPDPNVAATARDLRARTFRFFSGEAYPLADEQPWRTHPLTNVCFPDVHWSEVPDFNLELGDIKYVWEPSRFSHLYTLIRDEHHNRADHGGFVCAQLDAWLRENPVNRGPNYKCSQEISLRILNWTFALHYYKDHPALTEALWDRLQHNIYWSLHHVYNHIEFSRIAVRNNHAITETMVLWLGGLLYPWLPDVAEWSTRGRTWLEEELDYQLHPDGTYLQHSHNYQRVVVQLLNWAIRLGEVHGNPLPQDILNRAGACLDYLLAVQTPGGQLPNYGANDGALFFPLATQQYRDYRPQLDGLARALGRSSPYSTPLEEGEWLSTPGRQPEGATRSVTHHQRSSTLSFPQGGIFVHRTTSTLTFLKAQSYRDRPSQADNLHLDFWIDDENVLRDQGTFRYNADPADQRYFFGTASHNTVMLNELDQMTKGPRFVWLDWTQAARGNWVNENTFVGSIDAFRQLSKKIRHTRRVRIEADLKRLTVIDEISGAPDGTYLTQRWHPNPAWLNRLNFECADPTGTSIERTEERGDFSELYGIREAVTDLAFTTAAHSLTTTISWT